MTIILSTAIDVSTNNGLNIFGAFGDALGIPGFPMPENKVTGAVSDFQNFADSINNVINTLTGKAETERFDPNFVGSGRQVIVGGYIEGGKVPPLEEASIRQVYSQTPNISVIIKKRMFSSLSHLYDPTLMDPAEKWLMRATKRLTANKCVQMAQYERLSKIAHLIEKGASAQAIMASIISSALREDDTGDDVNAFTSARELEKAALDRQPAEITTYYADPDIPVLEDLGAGTGTFEITAISDVNTSLSIDGEGSCNFNIEDPYKILIVTEEDIEAALRDTALSSFVRAISFAAEAALDSAQSKDALLSERRRARNRSEISFTIGVGGNSGVLAVLDATGFQVSADNLADIPDSQSLDDVESTLFKSVLGSLEVYEQAMRKNLLQGLDGTNAEGIKSEMEYARKRLRLFHLGKAIIQPMDQIHVFIDGATRKSGEGEDVEQNTNIFTAQGALGVAGSILGLQDEAEIDDELLREEWQRDGQHMRYNDFKRLRMMQASGEGGVQVFGGLVASVADKFEAQNGKHTLMISAVSNMEWLKLSRFNAEPSLDQTQGTVYDPLTPFKFETDPATGLPTGRPQLSDANTRILQDCGGLYYNMPPFTGRKVNSDDVRSLARDLRMIGGSSVNLYQHTPGFVYRWKEGIMTATYNVSVVDPLDETKVSTEQLRRDVGWFPSHSPFDNMDSANIVSVLVTGQPYNLVSFIQSAQNSGTWIKDVTTNSGKDFFHSFLGIQRSVNKVQGNFVPFKHVTVDEEMFAKAISLQWKLTDRSSKLGQLQAQQARDSDMLTNLEVMGSDKDLLTQLKQKSDRRQSEIDKTVGEITSLTNDGKALQGTLLEFAGNNIVFNAVAGQKPPKVFGDRLIHAVMKRREDVVRARDKDYLIVSDDYDNDYDILAYAQKLKEQGPDLFKSTYQDVHQLCRTVANTLDFEFFADTQGNLVFRPPQYNRTPSSVLNKIISLNRTSGIKVYPDFLTSLFRSREESLINEVIMLEWEIRMNAALIGKTTVEEVQQMIFGNDSGVAGFFITDQVGKIKEAVKQNQQGSELESERQALYMAIKANSAAAQLTRYNTGAFTPVSQYNLLRSGTLKTEEELYYNSNKTAYETAQQQLFKLRGQKPNDGDMYDKVKVGVVRNGAATPETDINRIIGNIAALVSERTKLMQMLDKVMEQNVEIGSLANDGSQTIVQQPLQSTLDMNSGLYLKLVEDDTKNVLGHMSGARFIIKDEDIISSQYTENAPEITVATVMGTQPLVGEGGGNLASYPQYKAYGVDFDLWRQYGFRGEKDFDRPFLWSAEQQCAPYAVMLLSRQRKDVVKGTITLKGNEFYQLGDVVYVQERQMLYYVWKVSQQFSYGQDFRTTLDLRYGRPPGEYIPTPLDVIGKNLVLGGSIQNSFRVRREIIKSAQILGTIQFDKGGREPLKGQYAARNYGELRNAAKLALSDITAGTADDPERARKSSRVYVLAFGGDRDEQQSRMNSITDWFAGPLVPLEAEPLDPNAITNSIAMQQPTACQIPIEVIRTQYIGQGEDIKKLSKEEKDLLMSGVVAGEKTRLLGQNDKLANVIEIRLRQPPQDGWSD
jgi:hypothetical protein